MRTSGILVLGACCSMAKMYTISSPLTFFYKFLFPIPFVGMVVALACQMFLTDRGMLDKFGHPIPGWIAWLVFLGTTAMVTWCGISCWRLKRVSLDDNALFVSDYFQRISVPLTDLESVEETRSVSPRQVILKFGRVTEFGTTVRFMPPIRQTRIFSEHPVLEQVRTAADRACTKGQRTA